MKYQVLVEENSHYMDESERHTHGEFESAEVALSAAKAIVDDSLNSLRQDGMSAGELYRHYTTFGSDAFIVSADPDCHFSGWDYAKARCQEICKQPSNQERSFDGPTDT